MKRKVTGNGKKRQARQRSHTSPGAAMPAVAAKRPRVPRNKLAAYERSGFPGAAYDVTAGPTD